MWYSKVRNCDDDQVLLIVQFLITMGKSKKAGKEAATSGKPPIVVYWSSMFSCGYCDDLDNGKTLGGLKNHFYYCTAAMEAKPEKKPGIKKRVTKKVCMACHVGTCLVLRHVIGSHVFM
jgi:hypothetical protein